MHAVYAGCSAGLVFERRIDSSFAKLFICDLGLTWSVVCAESATSHLGGKWGPYTRYSDSYDGIAAYEPCATSAAGQQLSVKWDNWD